MLISESTAPCLLLLVWFTGVCLIKLLSLLSPITEKETSEVSICLIIN